VLLAVGLFVAFGSPAPFVRLIREPAHATAAVYVYEKDDGAVPMPVLAGLDKINRERQIVATTYEAADDGVPETYRVPLDAARQAGLPSLVVMAGVNVLATVHAPKTVDEVFGAVP